MGTPSATRARRARPPSSLSTSLPRSAGSLLLFPLPFSPLFSVTTSCPITVWLAGRSVGQAASGGPQVANRLTGAGVGAETTLITGSRTGWSVSRAGIGSNKCLMPAGDGSLIQPRSPRSRRCGQTRFEANDCGTRRRISIDMCRCRGCGAACLKAPVGAGGSRAGIDVSLTPRAAAKTTSVRRPLLTSATRRQTEGGSHLF